MQVNFYDNQSNENVINKTLKLVTSKDIVFRATINEKNPVLLIHNDLLNEVNYIEITNFKRYYYIEHVEAFNNQLSRVFLITDLLMTYQNEILNSEVLVTATEQPSYSSNQLPTTRQLISDKYASDVTLPTGSTKVLTTIGGQS